MIWYDSRKKQEGGGSGSWTDYESTLTAGSTSLTITGSAIKTTSVVEIYTDKYGVNPDDAVVTNGQIVLTFEAQSSDLGVLVRITTAGSVKPYDIELRDFVTNQVWYYYDAAYSQQPSATVNGLSLVGGEDNISWTTSASICVDLNAYVIPSSLAKIKLHVNSLTASGYAGLTMISSDTKFDGEASGNDAILRLQRLPIDTDVYVYMDATSGIEVDNQDIEFNCTTSDLHRYLYIMCCDGVEASWDGSSNTYNNSENGSYNCRLDGIWFE